MGQPSKLCPICGYTYRGDLAKHTDQVVKNSWLRGTWSERLDAALEAEDRLKATGVTRCDWNLNSARTLRLVASYRAAGWISAGPVAAKVALLLAPTHPHLARRQASGDLHTVPRRFLMGSEVDNKVWWMPAWAVPLALVNPMPMRRRMQLIIETYERPQLLPVLDATYRVGGSRALLALEGSVYSWCQVTLGQPPAPGTERGTTRAWDICSLFADHDGSHLGVRSGAIF